MVSSANESSANRPSVDGAGSASKSVIKCIACGSYGSLMKMVIGMLIAALLASGITWYFTGKQASVPVSPNEVSGEVSGKVSSVKSLLYKAVSAEDPVVAMVNGLKIHRSFLTVGEDITNEKYDILLDDAVGSVLLSSEAIKQGLNTGWEYEVLVDKRNMQFLIERYIDYLKTLPGISKESIVKERYQSTIVGNPVYQKAFLQRIVTDKNHMQRAMAMLARGESFDKVAKELSSGPRSKNGGKLGSVARTAFPKQVGDVIFALKDGEYTKQPVDIGTTKQIFRMIRMDISGLPIYKDVKSFIIQALAVEYLWEELLPQLKMSSKIETFNMDGSKKGIKDIADDPAAVSVSNSDANDAKGSSDVVAADTAVNTTSKGKK